MGNAKYMILAAVYRLLSEATADELREASRCRDVSDPLRTALRALAAESSRRSDEKRSRSMQQRESRLQKQRSSRTLGRDPHAQAIKLLSDRKHFPDKAALSRFAAGLGLEVKIERKWGMLRAIRAVAKVLSENPRILASLDPAMDQSLDPTTKGWMDLILGSK